MTSTHEVVDMASVPPATSRLGSAPQTSRCLTSVLSA